MAINESLFHVVCSEEDADRGEMEEDEEEDTAFRRRRQHVSSITNQSG